MAALDARGIEKARLATNQGSPRKAQLWQAVEAPGGDASGPKANALAALKEWPQRRMVFEPLELFKRRQPWVAIAQAHDQSNGHLMLIKVVDKGSPVSLGIERPASGVQHEARPRNLGAHGPDLLYADAVGLGICACIELKARDELTAKVATRALGKEGVLAKQRHAWLV